VAGAFEFCRHTPVEDLTMPQLAAFLNVGVTSIYWYFKSKRELLEAMTEEALTSFYESMPPLRDDSWEELLLEFFVSFYALLAGDELRCDLIVRRIGNHADEEAAGSWPRAEELLAALEDAGFPSSLARHAFSTLSIYTQGYLLVERTGRTAGPISSPGKGAESGAAGLLAGTGPREDFEFGIANIIRGLRVLAPGDSDASAVALGRRCSESFGNLDRARVRHPVGGQARR
jgi:AcrR family transcriptional regulator